MTSLFHASEIIEVGLRIEQNGGTFYWLLADKMTDQAVKELFLELAKEEEKHFDTLQELHNQAVNWEPLGTYAAEYRDYMECLAANNVFNKRNTAEEVTGGIKDKKDAIEYAQQIEKDSILFYMEMKESVPEKEKGIIQELIHEEKRHLFLLMKMELDPDLPGR